MCGQQVHDRNENNRLFLRKTTLKVGTPSRATASTSELKYHFNRKEGAKKFFYLYENLVMKNKTEEEKADSMVAYLDGEAFE